jgi:hypothetical protein
MSSLIVSMQSRDEHSPTIRCRHASEQWNGAYKILSDALAGEWLLYFVPEFIHDVLIVLWAPPCCLHLQAATVTGAQEQFFMGTLRELLGTKTKSVHLSNNQSFNFHKLPGTLTPIFPRALNDRGANFLP